MQERSDLLHRVALASISVAISLIVLKFIAWLMSGSVSILASLVDSMSDACASLLNLSALLYALKPADEDHPFGHGKAESIGALAQGMFILGSSLFLLFNAIERLMHPIEMQHAGLNIVVILISLLFTAALVIYQRYVLNKTNSETVTADHLHYLSDIASNLAVLAAIMFSALGWQRADSLFALGIALWMIYAAWLILRQALNTLMDRSLPQEDLNKMEQALLAQDEIMGVHDLVARQVGDELFVQYHLEFDDDAPLATVHAQAIAAKSRLLQLYPTAQIISHFDPHALAETERHAQLIPPNAMPQNPIPPGK